MSKLKATDLNASSCNRMFKDCTSLSYVDVDFEDWKKSGTTNYTYQWLQNAGTDIVGTKTFRCP